ncbi:hypothetical protein IC575_005391 [Cucumis melo]
MVQQSLAKTGLSFRPKNRVRLLLDGVLRRSPPMQRNGWGPAGGGGNDTRDLKIVNALIRRESGGRIQCPGGDGSDRRGVGCGVAACAADLNRCYPSVLEVKREGKIVGYKSGCLAAKSAKYCCRGEYVEAKKCKPSIFGHLFKAICPMAYSYAYDEITGLKVCRAPTYVITFCPPTSI